MVLVRHFVEGFAACLVFKGLVFLFWLAVELAPGTARPDTPDKVAHCACAGARQGAGSCLPGDGHRVGAAWRIPKENAKSCGLVCVLLI